MTNDQLARIERCIATGQRLDNYDANALLEQLRSNAADMVRVRKRLADAERGLELLERLRTSAQISDLLFDLREVARFRSGALARLHEELIALLDGGKGGAK